MKDIDINFKNIKKIVHRLKNKKLEVGIFDDAGINDNGEKIADYAIANEYGTFKNGKKHIPARSFVGATYDKNEKKYENLMHSVLDNILIGKDANIDSDLLRAGEVVRNDIVKAIDSNIPPENTDSTKKKKTKKHSLKTKKQGIRHTTLIDTGALRQSVNIRVKNV